MWLPGLILNRSNFGAAARSVPLLLVVCVCGFGQTTPVATSVIQGKVRDAGGSPAKGATVRVSAKHSDQQSLTTASDGSYRVLVPAGSYQVRATKEGCANADVIVGSGKTKIVDLKLSPCLTAHDVPDFSDDPKFTIAGVTDAPSPGGHGSNTALRTTESLAKQTVSLDAGRPAKGERTDPLFGPARKYYTTGQYDRARSAVNAVLEHRDTAEGHHLLADIEERAGHPLLAVREYQHAAAMDPSESNLFDWGAELLLHRAFIPATEVFERGNHLYPQSARMLIGLGVTWYARGSYDKAVRTLDTAARLDQRNATPYLFMGKILEAEVNPPKEIPDAMMRFAKLDPENALAYYYWALSEWKSRKPSDGPSKSNQVLAKLEKAVQLDPKLAPAYVQMGNVHAAANDAVQAITDYQKAVQISPELPQAHYRLAQIYRQLGEKEKANRELELFQKASTDEDQDLERERRAIRDFVSTEQTQAQPKN